jgi:hypothetical protein
VFVEFARFRSGDSNAAGGEGVCLPAWSACLAFAWLLIWARGSRVAARSGAPWRLAADAHAPLARSPNSVSLIDRTEPRSVLCVSRSALLWLFVVRNGH